MGWQSEAMKQAGMSGAELGRQMQVVFPKASKATVSMGLRPAETGLVFSSSANKLIADGAAAVTVPEDILRAAGIEPVMEAEEMEKMGSDEQKVYRLLLEKGELTVEELCAYMDADSFTVNGLVSVMELKGVISYCLGKIFIAKS